MSKNETEVMAEVIELLKGKTMSFLSLDTKERKEIKITDVRLKGNNGNLIFESEECLVAYFCPIQIFSIVEEETEKGWSGNKILDEVTIENVPFGHFMVSAISICS